MKISNTKIYEQVADTLLESIKSGNYQVGDKIPSIQKLSKEFGVSVASVRSFECIKNDRRIRNKTRIWDICKTN